ncbi:MAG: FAD-binding oxidoreductase [Thermoleophilia bacterium]|nr:FAD-binding oxidoreductase [Thermoleophilia bacterium]
MTTATPPRSDLRDALPPGTLVPGDPGYDQARLAWNRIADQNPAAIATPADAAEVAAVVRAARAAGLRVAPQSTGHNAPPLGDLSDAILLRTSRLREAEVDAAGRRARVGGGAWWDDVVPAASAVGMSVLHGSSPDVGVAGYTLGGGIGWQARRHGLACNSVTAVELVTADGERVRATADSEPDLFWALRGGGGNFGVVTALEFAMYPMQAAYAGWLIFDWSRSHEVLSRWAEWTLEAPEEVTSVGRILQLPPIDLIPEPLRGRNIVCVEAAFLGDEAGGRALMAPLRELGPEMDTFAMVPPAALARLHMDPEAPVPGMSGHAMLDAFGPAEVDAFLGACGPESGSVLISAEIRHLGGALGRPAPGAGALSHLDAGYVSFALGMPMAPEMAIAIDANLRRVDQALAPSGRGRSLLNFAESRTDAATAFGATAHERLRRIRAQADPTGLFRANHRI